MAALLLAAAPAGADIFYTWTDAQGRVHFSDRPLGDDSQPIEIPGAVRYPSNRPARDAGPRDAGAEGHDGTGDPQARAADDKERRRARERNCDIARESLKHNETIGRMYRVDSNNERVYLSDGEREAVLKTSRDNVGKWCD